MKPAMKANIGSILILAAAFLLAPFYQACAPETAMKVPLAQSLNETQRNSGVYSFVLQDGTSGLTLPLNSILSVGSAYVLSLSAADMAGDAVAWSVPIGSSCVLTAGNAAGTAAQVICAQGEVVVITATITEQTGIVDNATATLTIGALATPTPAATPAPTPKPTAKPTPKPTAKPTPKPTAKPTPKPTAKAHGQANSEAAAFSEGIAKADFDSVNTGFKRLC
jgi:cell division septation protein DedD